MDQGGQPFLVGDSFAESPSYRKQIVSNVVLLAEAASLAASLMGTFVGDQTSSSAGSGRHCALTMLRPSPSPIWIKIVLSWVQRFHTGWRKVPGAFHALAFPHSSAARTKYLSATLVG